MLSKMFRAEQAVLWGWKAEISTSLSKRICIWKRDVGTTRESYCAEAQMARRPGLGGYSKQDSPVAEMSSLTNSEAFQGAAAHLQAASYPLPCSVHSCLSPYPCKVVGWKRESVDRGAQCKGSPLMVSGGEIHLTPKWSG